jgi:beta-phosphoglucomutase-like phosphatase (HAD superfamily)
MRFEAVLFDCDGVLVDSEPIVNRILRDMLAERGWPLSQAECMRIFVGKMVRDERARIERETGQPLTDEWLAAFRARRNAALEQELCIVPGAQAAVHAVHERLDARIACASGADRPKLDLQLR